VAKAKMVSEHGLLNPNQPLQDSGIDTGGPDESVYIWLSGSLGLHAHPQKPLSNYRGLLVCCTWQKRKKKERPLELSQLT